jgi:hypothetical protein
MKILNKILYYLLKPLDAIGLLPRGIITPYPLLIRYYENEKLRYSESVENPVHHLLEFKFYFDELDFTINKPWKIYFEFEDKTRVSIAPYMFWSEERHNYSVEYVEAHKPVETLIGYISSPVPLFYFSELKKKVPYYFNKDGWFKHKSNLMAEISDAVLREAIDRPTWKDEVLKKVILNGKIPNKAKR